jgi:hypothetical protein
MICMAANKALLDTRFLEPIAVVRLVRSRNGNLE